jgi:uncharacterized protein (TIGR03067 family)
MRNLMNLAGLVLVTVVVVASGCSTAQKPGPVSTAPNSASSGETDLAILQGAWKGQESGGEGLAYLVITGQNMEVRGSDSREWYKGTFTTGEGKDPKQLTLAITECGDPKYAGKTSHVIYRMEGGTLTMTGNEPGNPEVPSSFDAPDARTVVFKRE